MWKCLRFPWVLARPSWLGICLMIIVMVKWSFSKVNKWSKSRTIYVNWALPTFITLLLLSSIIQVVVTLITSLNWSLRIDMTTSKNVVSLDKFLDKRCFFQNIHKWCGEWKKSCHTNATYRGFAKCLDHVWSCETCGYLDNYGLSCVWLVTKWWPL